MAAENIYVLYPRGFRSGGPEAVHQLVHTLREAGKQAFVFPVAGTEGRERSLAYAHYDAPEVLRPMDNANSAIVVPELWSRTLSRYRSATRYCWWLSIDNAPVFSAERKLVDHWSQDGRWIAPPRGDRLGARLRVAALRARGDYRALHGVHHLAQSEYAQAYLYIKRNASAALLTDWVSYTEEEAAPPPRVSNRVAYNPAKGEQLTRLVVQRMPDVEFVPLVDMSHATVLRTLRSSAIYLDLGHHPGRDRMPREAALCGAIAVVATRGSAAFTGDVPIPEAHKVAIHGNVVSNAESVIRQVLGNLDAAQLQQQGYRDEIRRGHSLFVDQVKSVFVRDEEN